MSGSLRDNLPVSDRRRFAGYESARAMISLACRLSAKVTLNARETAKSASRIFLAVEAISLETLV